MTDQPQGANDARIAREQAPAHGPNFWADLESSLTAQTSVLGAVDAEQPLDRTAELRALPAAVPERAGSVAALSTAKSAPSRRFVPFAAAAALLAIVGLGVLIARGSNDPLTTTEVVGAPTVEAGASALDGPDDGNDVDTEAPVAEATPGVSSPTAVPATTPAPATTPGTAVDPAPTAVPALPVFAAAEGAADTARFAPLDQGLPADATFLATWNERQVSWYAVADPDTDCTNAAHSEIRRVNGSGLTQSVRDPQLSFSGEISHFTLQPQENRAAWVVSCGTQLELHVATLLATGELADPDLAWLGEGTVRGALMLWDDNEVSFNSIEPGGTAFAIDYNVETKVPSRNGGPSRILLEAGAPGDRSLVPLAASPDGGLTYWAGEATTGTLSACPERFGSATADMLWLRQGEGQWVHAVGEDTPLGAVTAMALDPELSQVAFADQCPGSSGRLFIGTQRADGKLSNLREVDLTPYVPGYAEQLFWVDSETLRIETNNTEYGFGTVRFDFRFDDGNDNGIIVQLD